MDLQKVFPLKKKLGNFSAKAAWGVRDKILLMDIYVNARMEDLSDLVQSNVEIRRYGNEKWDRVEPFSFEDTFLMGFYWLGRLVSSIPDIKDVNHGVCWTRCYV
jgi:hypothetical protein